MSSSFQAMRQSDQSPKRRIRDLAVWVAASFVPVVLLSLATVTITAAGLWLMLPRLVNTLSGALAMFYAVVFFASAIAASKSRSIAVTGKSFVGALMWTVPPALVYLACGVLYVGMFLVGLVVMPFVIFAGMFYAPLAACAGVDYWQTALANMGHHLSRRAIERSLVALQWVALLATWPLFLSFLDLLASFGIKSGWD
ncbi:MAG: hypothetical protein KF708_20520 [Pirellulales bacterium]|nr:hypothetical protein [Pirellulales bacterium]